MSRREWWIASAAALFAAATRLLALARTPWDWDEMLFTLAIRDYNVALHHPHPPGFPLYIGAAKLLVSLGISEFHALQALSVGAGMLLFPAAFLFCREAGFDFARSVVGSLLLAFSPNVWFYGGAAFSDVPSLVLALFACALLLAGRRDDRAFLAGAVLLGIAAGFRPQNLLIGAGPMLLTIARRRSWMLAVAAAALVVAIAGGAYGVAVAESGGWKPYSERLHEHQRYITATDSFLNHARPPLYRLADDFFVRPYRAPLVNVALTLAAAIGFFRRRRPALVTLATFAPFAVFAWLFLDHFSASRFSIAYAPLPAFLAAEGIVWAGLVIVAVMIVWTFPALAFVRANVTPPVAAMRWTRASLDRNTTRLLADDSMRAAADVFLADYRRSPTSFARLEEEPAFRISESGRMFAWPHNRLWDLVRRRYFETSVTPVLINARFDSGWYATERSGNAAWRWMGRESKTLLPPLGRSARLSLSIYVPLDVMPSPPTIEIVFDGRRLDRFVAGEWGIERTYPVVSRGGAPHELVITTSATASVPNDRRALGLRLDQILWR
jgi:hypothetical protein